MKKIRFSCFSRASRSPAFLAFDYRNAAKEAHCFRVINMAIVPALFHTIDDYDYPCRSALATVDTFSYSFEQLRFAALSGNHNCCPTVINAVRVSKICTLWKQLSLSTLLMGSSVEHECKCLCNCIYAFLLDNGAQFHYILLSFLIIFIVFYDIVANSSILPLLLDVGAKFQSQIQVFYAFIIIASMISAGVNFFAHRSLIRLCCWKLLLGCPGGRFLSASVVNWVFSQCVVAFVEKRETWAFARKDVK